MSSRCPAARDALNACGTIEAITPAADGGYVLDCANGDRYRISDGWSSARYERSF